MGRDALDEAIAKDERISIHAPRMGRDFDVDAPVRAGFDISIHAPRMGRDDPTPGTKALKTRFQSTRPVWGATDTAVYVWASVHISIHAPRMGRDRI